MVPTTSEQLKETCYSFNRKSKEKLGNVKISKQISAKIQEIFERSSCMKRRKGAELQRVTCALIFYFPAAGGHDRVFMKFSFI